MIMQYGLQIIKKEKKWSKPLFNKMLFEKWKPCQIPYLRLK